MNLTSEITKYLKERRKQDSKKHEPLKENEFYISSSGDCFNKEWLRRRYPKATADKTLGIFEMGNLIHDFIQRKVLSEKNLGIEVPVRGEYGIITLRGRADIVDYDRQKVYELKTVGFGLSHVKERPRDHHVRQITGYMDILGYDKGEIVYVSKQNLEVIQHEVVFDPSIMKSVVAEFEDKAKFADFPDIQPGKEYRWQCNYCRWRQECEQLTSERYEEDK